MQGSDLINDFKVLHFNDGIRLYFVLSHEQRSVNCQSSLLGQMFFWELPNDFMVCGNEYMSLMVIFKNQ